MTFLWVVDDAPHQHRRPLLQRELHGKSENDKPRCVEILWLEYVGLAYAVDTVDNWECSHAP